MRLNQVNNVNFNGRIIDAHAHYGHWGDNQRYFGQKELDVFLKNPLNIDINGVKSQDSIEKMIVSPLDAIGTSASNARISETEGLRQAIEFAKDNEKVAIMPVCQPNLTYGNIEPLKQMLDENSEKVVGLKFHPRKLLEVANGQLMEDNPLWYDNYLRLAKEKNLPCLFHCDGGASGAEKIYGLVKERFPKLPVILGHTGAGSDENFQEALSVLKKSIDNNDAKIYADISWLDWENGLPDGNHTKVKTLITELKSKNALDRILFGTDAPLGCFGENPVNGVSEKQAYEKMVSGIKTMIKKDFPTESDEIIDKIFYKNAQNLFFDKNIAPVVKKSKLPVIIALTAVAIGSLALWANSNKEFLAKIFKK